MNKMNSKTADTPAQKSQSLRAELHGEMKEFAELVSAREEQDAVIKTKIASTHTRINHLEEWITRIESILRESEFAYTARD